MGLKITLKRHCEQCGKPQLRFTERNTVWRWHQCDKPIPGPHPVPCEYRLTDVLVETGDAVAPAPERQAAMKQLTQGHIESWREECASDPSLRRMIFADEWKQLCDLALKGLSVQSESAAPKDRHPICATDGCELLIPRTPRSAGTRIPTSGAYRWIEDAVPKLQRYRAMLDKAHIGKRLDDPLRPECEECARIIAVDDMLAGVPTPQVDLGFNSPADRAAQSASERRGVKFDAEKYYRGYRDGLYGEGWHRDETTSHEHVDSLEATVNAALNIYGTFLIAPADSRGVK